MGGDGKVQCNAKMVQSTGYKAFHYQAYYRPNVVFTGSSWYIPKSASTHLSMSYIKLWPYHLIKNRICPSISVAPRISSATSPLRNPLGSLGSGTSTLLLWFSPAGRSHHSHFKLLGLLYTCNFIAERYAAETIKLTTVRREIFVEENFHKLANVRRENFRRLLTSAAKNATPTNFMKKTFANIHKLRTLWKVFAWKFPAIQYEAHWWLFSSRWSPSF